MTLSPSVHDHYSITLRSAERGGWAIFTQLESDGREYLTFACADDEGLLEWLAEQVGLPAPQLADAINGHPGTGIPQALVDALQPFLEYAAKCEGEDEGDYIRIFIGPLRALAAAAKQAIETQARPPNPGPDPNPAAVLTAPPPEEGGEVQGGRVSYAMSRVSELLASFQVIDEALAAADGIPADFFIMPGPDGSPNVYMTDLRRLGQAIRDLRTPDLSAQVDRVAVAPGRWQAVVDAGRKISDLAPFYDHAQATDAVISFGPIAVPAADVMLEVGDLRRLAQAFADSGKPDEPEKPAGEGADFDDEVPF